jgi:hypothetical protein
MGRYLVVLLSMVALGAGVATLTAQEDPAGGEAAAASAASKDRSRPSDEETEAVRETEPQPGDTWEDMVKRWLTPRPVPKSLIIRIDEKYCYPHRAAAFKTEIVREDEDTVWVRGLPPEHPDSPLHRFWQEREVSERNLLLVRGLLEEVGPIDYYLDFTTEVVPPAFMDGLGFEATPSGLPVGGLWQMNFAVDDMDEDGVQDLVFPPTRKGRGRPYIYLGRPGGEFSRWRQTTWSTTVPYDYGGVATADFDGDGHRDIVLAIHFEAQHVLYGDGKGGFERSQRLPSPDRRITSRAPTVADFDGDGRDDVAFLAELDFDMGTSKRIEDTATAWVVRNTQTGWRLEVAGLPQGVIGDSLTAADLDADGRTDLVLGSSAANWRRLVYLNREDGWDGPLSVGVLSNAYHHGVDVYERPGQAAPVMFWTFVQFRFVEGENRALTGVIPYRLGENGLESPDGPVFYDDQRRNPVFRVAAGDLNADGRIDLVAGRRGGGLDVFVQSQSGEYYREQSPEMDGLGRAYAIRLLDLDGDGLDDVVASFAQEGRNDGGVRVWLTRDRS